MPRKYRQMTWRVGCDFNDRSNDATLQTLRRSASSLQWITVARGDREDLANIAQALNEARFTLFDYQASRTHGESK